MIMNINNDEIIEALSNQTDVRDTMIGLKNNAFQYNCFIKI